MLEARELGVLADRLGDDLVVGIARLFIWVDRLQSLCHFALWNIENCKEGSVPYSRNVQAIVWQAATILYEAADAIAALNRARIWSKLDNPAKWAQLVAIEKRWSKDKTLKLVRDKLGAHADEVVVRSGLEAARLRRVEILMGNDITSGQASYRMGLELLLRGAGFSLTDHEQIAKTLKTDHPDFIKLVDEVFLDLLRHEGLLE